MEYKLTISAIEAGTLELINDYIGLGAIENGMNSFCIKDINNCMNSTLFC